MGQPGLGTEDIPAPGPERLQSEGDIAATDQETFVQATDRIIQLARDAQAGTRDGQRIAGYRRCHERTLR